MWQNNDLCLLNPARLWSNIIGTGLQTGLYSSIANMSGFLLWLSILWLRFSKSLQTQWILFHRWKWFILQRNSPELLQAYNPALGGYIIQNEITSNTQVSCHCKHAPWHLGANAKSFFAHFIEDPTHHIIMSRPLGATNRSCQQFKVHKY